MAKKPDFSYVNQQGKRVTGVAAFNHHVFTEMGGIKNYNDSVGLKYVVYLLRMNSQAINDEIEEDARQSRLKLIN